MSNETTEEGRGKMRGIVFGYENGMEVIERHPMLWWYGPSRGFQKTKDPDFDIGHMWAYSRKTHGEKRFEAHPHDGRLVERFSTPDVAKRYLQGIKPRK